MLADKPYYLPKAFFLLLLKSLAGLIEDQGYKPKWKFPFVWCYKNKEALPDKERKQLSVGGTLWVLGAKR